MDTQRPVSFGDMMSQNLGLQDAAPPPGQAENDALADNVSKGVAGMAAQATGVASSVPLPDLGQQQAATFQPLDVPANTSMQGAPGAPVAAEQDDMGFNLQGAQGALAALQAPAAQPVQDFPQDPTAPPTSIGQFIMGNLSKMFSSHNTEKKAPADPHHDDYEVGLKQARADISESMTGNGWKLDKATKVKALTPFYQGRGDISTLAPPALSATYDFVAAAQEAGYKPIITSGKREGDSGYHGYGEALDVVLLDKKGRELGGKEGAKMVAKWARRAGWATVLDEGMHPIKGHTTGAHYHLAWGTDGQGLAGAEQLISRKPGDKNYLTPKAGYPVDFKDALHLVEKHDMKTIPGKAARAAQIEGIDSDLFTRQIQAESNFQDQVNERSGARGWAQFMPATAAERANKMGVDLQQFYSNPMIQLKGAAGYVKDLANMFGGDMALGMAAYNWGPGMIQAWQAGKALMPTETKNYIHKIFKDRFPEALPSPSAVEGFLRSGKAPKVGQIKPVTESKQYAEVLAHPVNKLMSALFPGPADVAKAGAKLGYSAIDSMEDGSVAKSALQSLTGFQMDTEKGPVDMGLSAVVQDAAASFVNHFLWGATDMRKGNIAKYDQVMADFASDHPNWNAFGNELGRKGLPMFAGMMASTEVLLGMGGLLPGAAGRFFAGSKRAGHFLKGFEAAESEGLSGVLGGLRNWMTANGGASKILSSSLPLGFMVGMDAGGRTAVEMAKNGFSNEEIFPAVLKSVFTGLGVTLGLNVLAPLGGQVVLGSILKSPEAAGAMGQIFAEASPLGKKVMLTSGGAITGAAASQVANFTASLFGGDLDISPQMGAALGVGGAFAASPTFRAAAALTQVAEKANPKAMAATKDFFARTWKSMNQAYESTGTDEIVEAAKEVHFKHEQARVNLKSAERWVELNKEEAEARVPGIETMERQARELDNNYKTIAQQKEVVKQQLADMDAQLSGDPMPKLYEQAQMKVNGYEKEMAAIEQQRAQVKGDPKQAYADIATRIKLLKDEKAAAESIITKVKKDHPEIIRISDQKQKLKVLSDAEAEAKTNFEEFQKYVGPVLSAEKKLSAAQLAEAERVAALPDEVKADPAFDLAHQNKLLEFQHGVGEVPSVLGIDPATVAQLADENFHQSIRNIAKRIQTEGDRIWDAEYNLKGRQIARAAALKEGSASDLFVAQKWAEYNKIAQAFPDDLGKVLYGKTNKGFYSSGQPKFKEVLENQSLKWKEDQFHRFAGKRAKGQTEQSKAVRVSYILQAGKEAGYNLDLMRNEIATTRSKGMKSYLDVQSVEASGKTFEYSGKEYNKFEPSQDLVRQALAAESVGDNWVPINHQAADGAHVDAYIKHLRKQELKDTQAHYAEMAKDVLGYAADRQEQVILNELYGGAGTLVGGETVISEPLHPGQLEARVMQRMQEKGRMPIGPRQAEAADHLAEMRSYFEDMTAKNPTEMKQAIIGSLSEEMELLSRLGENLAGGSKKAMELDAKAMKPIESPEGIPIAMSPDGLRQYMLTTDKAGNPSVAIAKRRVVASGADTTKLALGLEGFKASPTVSDKLDLIKGSSALSDQKGRIVATADLKRELANLENSTKVLTEIEVKGASGQRFYETQGRAQRVAEELAMDIEDAMAKTLDTTYSSLPETLRNKVSNKQFVSDVVDMIEDVSLGQATIKKYGEPARQLAVDILEVTKAIDQVRTSSPWADKTARSSYFMHQYPTLRQHILSMYGEEGTAGLSVAAATEGAMRDFDTHKQVREFASNTRDKLTGVGIDPKDFINMTPKQRVENFLGSKVDVAALSEEQLAKHMAQTNKMAHSLIMDADVKNINPGQVLGNKLRSVYHQEGTRQMLELLMRSKTLGTIGRDGSPATLLYHAKDSSTSRIVETPQGPQAYKRLNQAGSFGSTEIKLFGETYRTGDLMIHPEAFKFLNDYAGSMKPNWMRQGLKDVVAFVNQTNLLGGIPAHLFQTMEAVMGETMAGFYSGAGKLINLSGAGRRMRNQGVAAAGDGRLYELYAIRHGLNAKALANTSFDIAEAAMTTMGDDFASKLYGVSDSNVKKLFQTFNYKDPASKLARQHLAGGWAATSDFINTPIHMEMALQRHLTFQSIRDAQVAAFYARAGHFMNSVPELQKIADPSARFSAALRASAEVANQQAGSIPYHRLHKWVREGGQIAQMTPGWFFTQANAVMETMNAVGYTALGPLRYLAPEAAVKLRKLGHKLGIGKRHPDLPPEVAESVRNRIVTNVAGVGLASVLYTETFNMLMNGRTSYQEADGNAYGKLVVGNSTLTTPFAGYVRRLTRLMHKGGAIAAGTTDDSVPQVLMDEILNSLSPFITGIIPMLKDSTAKEKMASNMESNPSIFTGTDPASKVLGGVERVGKQLASGASRMLGMNELVGYKDTAGIGDVLGLTGAQGEAQRLNPTDYVMRQDGFYRGTPKVARNIMAVGQAKEGFYRAQASKEVANFLQAAADNPKKAEHFFKLASEARMKPVIMTDPESIAANGGQKEYYLSDEAFQNLVLQYRDPANILESSSGISRGIVEKRMEKYEGTTVNPYQSLIREETVSGAADEEEE